MKTTSTFFMNLTGYIKEQVAHHFFPVMEEFAGLAATWWYNNSSRCNKFYVTSGKQKKKVKRLAAKAQLKHSEESPPNRCVFSYYQLYQQFSYHRSNRMRVVACV